MDEPSMTPPAAPSIEFSLANGQIFQRVIENPNRFNLTPTDRLLLEEGRQSMISRARFGFLIGAILSPLPLFRGEYAINNLRRLPPLMDRVTQKPNPGVIRARMFWIAQSVVLTTLGSGLGTWIGFKLGLRSMERSLSSFPGTRQRVIEALSQAHQELESTPLDQPNSTGVRASIRPSKVERDDSQDGLAQEQGEEGLLRRPPAYLSSSKPKTSLDQTPQAVVTDDESTSGSSRWEQLRRLPRSHPSTWEIIREQNLKRPSQPSRSPLDHQPTGVDSSSPPALDGSQSQDEFEKLLERERNLSAGLHQPSDGYSSTKS